MNLDITLAPPLPEIETEVLSVGRSHPYDRIGHVFATVRSITMTMPDLA